MSRLGQVFKELRQRGEGALVGFVTAGDPNPETSLALIRSMCEAGLDVLELGVPFSDPTADGPVIQRSSARALGQGMTLEKVFGLCREIRRFSRVPVVIFSYYNPILAVGPDAFYEKAVDAGADGVLVVDLPPEESPEMLDAWKGRDLDLIRLVAPTTPTPRMEAITREASGFVYLVSMTGVTGSAGLDLSEVEATAVRLKQVTSLPVCVGFGISKPEHVEAVCGVADGAVVGSAFERLIEENLETKTLPDLIGSYTQQLKAATRKTLLGAQGNPAGHAAGVTSG
ncbi:tryptophan synthase, alpha chain [Desulfacinum hydrothermale DSM 13146]|uniref:Tryptophan synthase alpha chain n=1 Tax=Desulfacinum hydrothermale DSM 13146 TaxID=1121390 RepID=A0A1W1XSD7_9BACT|nr:tryptophan synthase subunit alpha [Desulfacinum hydrothermale]SMC26774.1 tryptophan synthase, alpha chain [Desulfacinum hydrothermale DSM 13146]